MPRQVRVKGLRELADALNKFPFKLRTRAIKRAVKAGAKIIEPVAEANAPVLSGATRRGITVKASNSRKNPDRIRASVLVLSGKRRGRALRKTENGDDPFYWRFQEFGWRAIGNPKSKGRPMKRSSRFPRRFRSARRNGVRNIPGKRFMSRAFNQMERRAIVAFRRQLRKDIEKYDAKRN